MEEFELQPLSIKGFFPPLFLLLPTKLFESPEKTVGKKRGKNALKSSCNMASREASTLVHETISLVFSWLQRTQKAGSYAENTSQSASVLVFRNLNALRFEKELAFRFKLTQSRLKMSPWLRIFSCIQRLRTNIDHFLRQIENANLARKKNIHSDLVTFMISISSLENNS